MSWVHENLLLPFFEPERHRGLARRLRTLRRFEAASRADQVTFQANRLRALLEHAYNATPYYRDVFKRAGFNPSRWQPGSEIPVPILSRDLLRTHGDALKSEVHAPTQVRAAVTGGTTGTPIKLWRDITGLRDKTALQYHLDAGAGFHQGDSVLAIWGAERDLALDTSYRRKFYEQRLMRRFPAPAGQVSDAVFSSFLEKLNRHRPKVLYGYSATMARFAEFVQQSGHAYHRPRIIIATAETLTDVDRQILEKVFGCRVNEQYGSRDIGMVATECHEHSGLHFHPAACFVEFVYAGETAEGPMHRLIITDLYNYGMPLIRYDTDDCVLPEKTPCVCGSWFPRVRRILGRGLDNFLLTDGTQVPGIALTVHMARISGGFRHVSQVQVIQRSLNRITIRYAAKGNEEDIKKELFRLRDCIQELLKTRLHFTYDRVPVILRERSGKLRLCISEINKTTWPQLS